MNQLQIKPRELSAMAETPRDVDSNSFEGFRHFYTNGRPDAMYVMMSSFLAWKKVKVKKKGNTELVSAKSWTLAYREIAADMYSENEERVIKKDANGYLLFDGQFLIDFEDEARSRLMASILG